MEAYDERKDAYRGVIAAVGDGDLATLDVLMAPDVIDHNPMPGQLVSRINGDVLPTLLVDGHVAECGWRPVDGASRRRRSTGFPTRQGVGSRHRRSAHWWTKLPSAETRVHPDQPLR